MEPEQKVQTPAKEKGATSQAKPQEVPKANRNVKDSVFRDIFSDKRYLLQLYQTLHPEDNDCTEEDLTCVTLEQILVRDIHNDLGFIARDRSLIMLEAQSNWTVNIIVRSLLYIARTYQDYFRESAQSLFTTKPVHMLEPEIYVVYSGNEKIGKEWITLTEELFGEMQTALEVRVKDIMFTLFDQEEVLRDFIASERREQAEETTREVTREVTREAARALYENNVAIEVIAKSLKQNVRTIESWLGLVPQM